MKKPAPAPLLQPALPVLGMDMVAALMIAHVESNKRPNYGGGIWYGKAQDGTSGQASRP
jgi:hypothetical protein